MTNSGGSAYSTNEQAVSGSVLVVQHNGDNGPGLVARMSLPTVIHRSDLNPELPSLDGVVGLVVLGGPQTSFSDDGFASRRNEIALLRQAVTVNVPVLGICLGAQLLAVALGARTYRRDVPEIGYLPVSLTAAGIDDALFAGCPPRFSPRQYHHDSFELPAGAVRLASSEQCVEQGFRYGPAAWGLQFHFEMDARSYGLAKTTPDVAASLAALEPTASRILANFCDVVRQVGGVQVSAAS